MNPFIENAITSLIIGLGAAATSWLSSPDHDIASAVAVGIVTLAGAFGNGVKQLYRQTPGTSA